MSTEPSPLVDLPHLARIFEALRRGRHICPRDGDLYHALHRRTESYQRLFDQLGFRLLEHPREFFYFQDASNFTDLSARMAVFVYILVEHLADSGAEIEKALLTRSFTYAELPHLEGERYLQYMREAGVTNGDDLVNLVRTMERFGFACRQDAHTFGFLPPVYRFLDLCMDVKKEEVPKPEDAS
jgi:hypothetical protein